MPPYSAAQLSALKESFCQNNYLTRYEEERLEHDLQLTKRQLRNWFKNHRHRQANDVATGSFGVEPSRHNATERGYIIPDTKSSAALVETPSDASSDEDNVMDVDWAMVDAVLDSIQPVQWLNEYYITRSPLAFNAVQPLPDFVIHGQVSQLDALSTAPRMALWLKQLCNSVGVEAPSIKVFSFDCNTSSLIFEQLAIDSSIEAEPWFSGIRIYDPSGRQLGMHNDGQREAAGVEKSVFLSLYNHMPHITIGPEESRYISDAIEQDSIARKREQTLLGDAVIRDLLPAKFDNAIDPAVQQTIGVLASFSLPVVRRDGALDGVVVIGTKHDIDEPMLNRFMSSLSLSVRQL